MNDAVLFEAVGEILKEEKASSQAEISALEDKLLNAITSHTPDGFTTHKELQDAKSDLAKEITNLSSSIKDESFYEGIQLKLSAFSETLDSLKASAPSEDAIVDRVIAYADKRIPEAVKGEKGDQGEAGADAEVDVEQIISEVVKHIPEPLKGEAGEKGIAGEKGTAGEKGEQGEDGKDGIDRPVYDLYAITAGDKLAKGSLGFYKGAVYQANRKTKGSPAEDANGWTEILTGVEKAVASYNKENRTIDITTHLTSGDTHTSNLPDLPRFQKEIVEGEKHINGDFTVNGKMLEIYIDGEWHSEDLTGPEGAQGAEGSRGSKGRAGKDGVGIKSMEMLTSDNSMVAVVEMTDGTTKNFVVDVQLPEYPEVDQEIVRYAGKWVDTKSYVRGDVVTAFSALFLCLQDTSAIPGSPSSESSWISMLKQASGGAAGNNGGVTPKDLEDYVLKAGDTMTGELIVEDANITVNNISIGDGEGDGANNTVVGRDSGQNLTIGYNNSSFGFEAAMHNTAGFMNTAIGNHSQKQLVTGGLNTAVGANSLNKNVTGSQNVAIGTGAAQFITGEGNTYLGGFSGNKNGLDLRAENNHVVISDGTGNARLWVDNNGEATFTGGLNVTNEAALKEGASFGNDTDVMRNYSRGIWTPVDASGSTVDSVIEAVYVRIGDLVLASCYITASCTDAYRFRIDGLPFEAANYAMVNSYYNQSASEVGYGTNNTVRGYITKLSKQITLEFGGGKGVFTNNSLMLQTTYITDED